MSKVTEKSIVMVKCGEGVENPDCVMCERENKAAETGVVQAETELGES